MKKALLAGDHYLSIFDCRRFMQCGIWITS